MSQIPEGAPEEISRGDPSDPTVTTPSESQSESEGHGSVDWDAMSILAEYNARRGSEALAQGLGVGLVDSPYLEESLRLSADLSAYMGEAWHLLEPKALYIPNWHIDAISEHLAAVSSGEIQNLLMTFPPRCMKSLSMVFWQTWTWTKRPEVRWFCTSYDQELSTRDSLKCRWIIRSRWYQDRWGHVYQLSGDQNLKERFENDRRGYRIASSIGASGTGEGGDVIVFDDPHNVMHGESDARRELAVRYWRESMSTRGNTKAAARVVIQQRVHQRDVAGDILETEGDNYVHLMLPMRFDPARRCVTVLGFIDPRKEEGELMWPDRFDEKAVQIMERRLGPYGTAGQLQQSPVARSGGQFEAKWFGIVPSVPRGLPMVGWVRYWDKAGTEGAGAYTVGLLAGLGKDGVTYIKDVVRGQWAAGDRERMIKITCSQDASDLSRIPGEEDRFVVLNVVEQEPGSGGKDAAEATIRNLAGYRCEAERPTGDKFERADPLAGAAKLGDVKLVRGEWNDAFLDEMQAAGPGAAYLDQMDAASGAYNRLQKLRDWAFDVTGMSIEELDQESPHIIA